MNCLSAPASRNGQRSTVSGHTFSARFSVSSLLLALILLIGCGAPASETPASKAKLALRYVVDIVARPEPSSNTVEMSLSVQQSKHLLRELRMDADVSRFSGFAGDGDLTIENDRVVWQPPEGGGTLSWQVSLSQVRSNGGFDARMTDDWALFRASDIFPPAATRTLSGAYSKTTIEFELPANWTSTTQYAGTKHRYEINNPKRRFDRPTGWILLGRSGIRTENIAGIRVKVAGPIGHDVRRLDMLAMLNWALPDVRKLLPEFPDRLTVFSAGDPMWRGGLSAPTSIYIHSDRPLISENGTSTLIHELMHVGMRLSAENGADWIVEGLAEYYALEILKRSGTISEKRFTRAMQKLKVWSARAQSICSERSSGATTAKSTVILQDLDQEIRKNSGNKKNLDDVLYAILYLDKKISVAEFLEKAEQILQRPSAVLRQTLESDCGELLI